MAYRFTVPKHGYYAERRKGRADAWRKLRKVNPAIARLVFKAQQKAIEGWAHHVMTTGSDPKPRGGVL